VREIFRTILTVRGNCSFLRQILHLCQAPSKKPKNWLFLRDFEGFFRVSNLPRLFSAKKNKFKKKNSVKFCILTCSFKQKQKNVYRMKLHIEFWKTKMSHFYSCLIYISRKRRVLGLKTLP
jgi:hypothetical protein